MTYTVNPERISGIALEASRAISGKDFDNVEVLLGLSELIGRIIVEIGSTRIQLEELAKVSSEHILRTVVAGAQAQGKGNIIQVQ